MRLDLSKMAANRTNATLQNRAAGHKALRSKAS
jgi:hypothetical protein